MNKFDTNEYPNIFVKEKLIQTNVRIYIRDQYIRISLLSKLFNLPSDKVNRKRKKSAQESETHFLTELQRGAGCVILVIIQRECTRVRRRSGPRFTME